MLKSTKKYLCMGVAVVLLLSGCDDFLNVNKDPNAPEDAPVDMQLAPIIAGFSYSMHDSWPSITSANFTQQISSNGDPYYYNVDWYQLGQPWFVFSDVWTSGYATVGKNALAAAKRAEEEGYSNFEGIAKLFYVWNVSMLTDLYGDIPYSEAFDPANPTPAYESQEDIYPKLFTILDEAISALEEGGPRTLDTSDLLYNGDMDKWIRLAYTLKARLLMRLTEAPDNQKQERADAALTALSNGFQNNDDNAEFSYIDQEDARNPWYRTRQENSEHIQMSDHYIELLKSLDDPRLSIHADTTEEINDPEQYVGHVNGAEGVAIERVSSIGTAFAGADAPGRLMDYAEAKFLEAEALFITEGAASADPVYREAIRADMESLDVPDADITTYLTSLPSLDTSSNALEDIITQKYIANFLNPEAWNDWRRTGYPTLTPAVDAEFDEIPRRYPWAGSELNNNFENIQATGLPTNYTVMLEKVWWDTRD